MSKRALEGAQHPDPKRTKKDEGGVTFPTSSVLKEEEYQELHKGLRIGQLRRELENAEERVRRIERHEYDYNATLLAVESAWDQLTSDLRALIAHSYLESSTLPQDVKKVVQDIEAAIEEEDESVLGSSFLSHIVQYGIADAEGEAADAGDEVALRAAALRQKCAKTEELMRQVVHVIDAHRKEYTQVKERVAEAAEGEAKKLIEVIEKKLEIAKNENDILHAQLRAEKAQGKEQKEQIKLLESEIGTLTTERDILEESVKVLERQRDREQALLAKSILPTSGGQRDDAEDEDVPSSSGTSSAAKDAPSTLKKEAASGDTNHDQEAEIELLKEESSMRLKEIKSLETKINALNSQARGLRENIHTLESKDNAETRHLSAYKQHLASEEARMSSIISRLQEELITSKAAMRSAVTDLRVQCDEERKAFAEKLQQEVSSRSMMQIERDSLAKQLQKAERAELAKSPARLVELEALVKSQGDELRRVNKRIAKLTAAHEKLKEARGEELKKLIDDAAKESEETITSLATELGEMGEEYESMQEQNTRLLEQLKEKESSNAVLVKEQIHSAGELRQMQTQLELTQAQLVSMEAHIKNQEALLRAKEQEATQLNEILTPLREQVDQLTHHITGHGIQARTATVKLEEECSKSEHVKLALEKCKADCREAEERAEKLDAKLRRSEEKRKLAQKQLSEYRAKGDVYLEEELAVAKTKLRCGVCNDRQKDAVIRRCMHVFCYACIKKNLDSRERRCPSCNQRFDKPDVAMFFL
eukprot:TRINITY_DN5488_c0_g1_i1.p1 TRINITY_DN5488_c0_g1~~TRINITY_DN5488_c0_g1_i1.p1  ORF type:complete len:765 (+),score=242.24 TRINITY_DN5488_c0_g1_i1:266-2560(+)